MPSSYDIEGQALIDVRGRRIGTVTDVLFHPREPRVVGFQFQPPAFGYVISRAPRYVPLDQVCIAEESLRYSSAHPVTGRAAEKIQGFTWDETVVWRGMPVVSESGELLGLVRDVRFSERGGAVREIALTSGVAVDAAVGTYRLAGDLAVGFDLQREAVVVRDEALSVELTGGVAATAGRSTAAAKVAAEKVAQEAAKGVMAAVRVAARSKVTKEVTKRAASGWKAFREGLSEGMREKD